MLVLYCTCYLFNLIYSLYRLYIYISIVFFLYFKLPKPIWMMDTSLFLSPLRTSPKPVATWPASQKIRTQVWFQSEVSFAPKVPLATWLQLDTTALDMTETRYAWVSKDYAWEHVADAKNQLGSATKTLVKEHCCELTLQGERIWDLFWVCYSKGNVMCL